MPRQEVFCDLCGGKFFAHSLPIHRKKCKEKVATQLHECVFCGEMFTHLDMDSHVSQCKAAKAVGAKPTGQSAQLRQRLVQDCPSIAPQGTPRARTPTPRSSTPIRRSNTPTPSRQEDNITVATPRKSRSSAPAAEAPPVNLGLIPCQFCGRSFNMDRIAKHTSICQKIKKERPVFRSEQKRVYCEGGSGGTVIASGVQPSSGAKAKTKATSRSAPVVRNREAHVSGKPSWREKSEAFREAMRAARGAASPSTPEAYPRARVAERRRSQPMTLLSPDSPVSDRRWPAQENSPMSDSSGSFPVGDLDKTLRKPFGGSMKPEGHVQSKRGLGDVGKSQHAADRRPAWNSNTELEPQHHEQAEGLDRRKVKANVYETPPASRVRAKSCPKTDVPDTRMRSSQTPTGRAGARTPPSRKIVKSSTPPPRQERKNSISSQGAPQRTPKSSTRPGVGMSKAAQQHLAEWGDLDLEPEISFTPVGRSQKPGRGEDVPKMDSDFEDCFAPNLVSRKRIGGGVGVSKAALQHAAVWEAMEQHQREAAAGCTPTRRGSSSNKINPMARANAAQQGFDNDQRSSGYGMNAKTANHYSRENPMAKWR